MPLSLPCYRGGCHAFCVTGGDYVRLTPPVCVPQTVLPCSRGGMRAKTSAETLVLVQHELYVTILTNHLGAVLD